MWLVVYFLFFSWFPQKTPPPRPRQMLPFPYTQIGLPDAGWETNFPLTAWLDSDLNPKCPWIIIVSVSLLNWMIQLILNLT